MAKSVAYCWGILMTLATWYPSMDWPLDLLKHLFTEHTCCFTATLIQRDQSLLMLVTEQMHCNGYLCALAASLTLKSLPALTQFYSLLPFIQLVIFFIGQLYCKLLPYTYSLPISFCWAVYTWVNVALLWNKGSSLSCFFFYNFNKFIKLWTMLLSIKGNFL